MIRMTVQEASVSAKFPTLPSFGADVYGVWTVKLAAAVEVLGWVSYAFS